MVTKSLSKIFFFSRRRFTRTPNKVSKEFNIRSTITLNDGNKIPVIGFGTYQSPPEKTTQSVTWALEAGYRHIDSAEIYGTEANVSEGIKRSGVDRNDIWITTKLWNSHRTSDETIKTVQSSLKKLNTDYIDLYLVHSPLKGGKNGENVIKVYGTLHELKEQGKIKSVGVSNFNINHLEILKKSGLPLPSVNQIEIHPYLQETELINYCNENNIVLEAYSPLVQGKKMDDETLTSLSSKYNVSPAQILLRWSIQRGFVTLPKSITKERIINNIDIFTFSLNEEDIDLLNSLEKEKLRCCWNTLKEVW